MKTAQRGKIVEGKLLAKGAMGRIKASHTLPICATEYISILNGKSCPGSGEKGQAMVEWLSDLHYLVPKELSLGFEENAP